MNETRYPLAERFKAPQGEGLHTGTPMAFIRFVGCSVGKQVCHACDTDFDKVYENLGGGLFTAHEILEWAGDYQHVCFTGGEPLDRNLCDLVLAAGRGGFNTHIETSGTKWPSWLDLHGHPVGAHVINDERHDWKLWVTVSPKPGFIEEFVKVVADEIKVIIGGLGPGPGWPTLADAARWASEGKLVYLQPRNSRLDIDRQALDEAIKLVQAYPTMRLSVQMHKFLRTR